MAARAQHHAVERLPIFNRGSVVRVATDRLARSQDQVAARAHERRIDLDVLGKVGGDLDVLGEQAERELSRERAANHLLLERIGRGEVPTGGLVEHIDHHGRIEAEACRSPALRWPP